MLWQKGLFFAPDGSEGSGGTGGTGTEGTQNQTSGSASASSTDAGEWEKKYKGLQTLVNKLNGEKEKLVADQTTNLATIEEQKVKITNLEGQVTKLTADLDLEKKNVGAAKTEVTTKTSEATRLRLILKEFPQLAPFEVAGALPAAATEDEARTRFQAFATALTTVVSQNTQDKLKGSSAAANTQTSVEPTLDSLGDRMRKIAGLPAHREEYAKLQVEYDKLLMAQQAKK